MIMKQRPRFTLEALISAPRRSAAIPSPTGTHVLYTLSKYSLESQSDTSETMVMKLDTGESTLFTDDKEKQGTKWLGIGTKVVWMTSKNGATEVWIGEGVGEKCAYMAGKIDAAIGSVKTKVLDDGNIAFAFVAKMKSDGTLFNTEQAEKPKTSAREYECIQVRYGDRYYTAEKSTLWYTVLKTQGAKYKLSPQVINALKGSGIEFPAFADGEGGDYHISVHGLVVQVYDPEYNLAVDLKSSLFYIPLKTFSETEPKIRRIEPKDPPGTTWSSAVSPDGSYLAFTQSENLRHSKDTIYIGKLSELASSNDSIAKVELAVDGKPWDRDPWVNFFSNDGRILYLITGERARTKLFKLELHNASDGSWSASPQALTSQGSLSFAQLLSDKPSETRILYTYNTLVNSSVWALVDAGDSKPTSRVISDLSLQNSTFGLNGGAQVSEFYAPGDEGAYQVHSWVIKPSFFKEGEKYPLWFAIHGGPQGTWDDEWKAKTWNLALWAEQGFVVVAPNPSGSRSFGFEYTDAVMGDYSGRAYRDLVACYDYVADNMPFVDLDRAVAGGASYGGYMTNFMAGHELGKKFKGLVCHDGIFNVVNEVGADQARGFVKMFGAELWKNAELYYKHSPSSYTADWSVPMLVIHSDGDYRCQMIEGLSAYNTCQMKGIPSRFLNFPDEGHYVQKPENVLQWYKSVLGWCNHYARNEGNGGVVRLEEPLTRKAFKKVEVGR